MHKDVVKTKTCAHVTNQEGGMFIFGCLVALRPDLALLTPPSIAGALCVVEDGFDGGGVVLGEVGLELLEFLDIGGEFCEQGAAVG